MLCDFKKNLIVIALISIGGFLLALSEGRIRKKTAADKAKDKDLYIKFYRDYLFLLDYRQEAKTAFSETISNLPISHLRTLLEQYLEKGFEQSLPPPLESTKTPLEKTLINMIGRSLRCRMNREELLLIDDLVAENFAENKKTILELDTVFFFILGIFIFFLFIEIMKNL